MIFFLGASPILISEGVVSNLKGKDRLVRN